MENNYEPEIWVDLRDDKLQGTEEKYSISSYGRVWNKIDECFVAQSPRGRKDRNNDYAYVNLRIKGQKRRGRRVHYLMAYSFLGAPPKEEDGVTDYTCDHIDRDRHNNMLWNLRWLSKKGQMCNRECSVLWEGEPLINIVREDYKELDEEPFASCSSFIRTQVGEKDFTYEQAKELYRQREFLLGTPNGGVVVFEEQPVYVAYLSYMFNVPHERTQKFISEGYSLDELFPVFKIKGKDVTNTYEVCPEESKVGKWYPSKSSLCRGESVSEDVLNRRTSQGLSLEEALLYDPKDQYRTSIGGFFMSITEHCERLNVSAQRVHGYMKKRGMTLENALDKAKIPEKIIKHKITGISKMYGTFDNDVRRNKAWWEFFGLSPIYCNGRMCRGYTMAEVLEYKNMNTKGLTITPYTK